MWSLDFVELTVDNTLDNNLAKIQSHKDTFFKARSTNFF